MIYMDKNALKKYTTEIIFNQDELNVFLSNNAFREYCT